MLSAFIDESERGDKYYFLGAGIATKDQEQILTHELNSILESYSAQFDSLHPQLELHGNEILSGRKEWRAVPLRARFAIFNDCLSALAGSGVVVYIEGIDIERQKARNYKYLTPARELALSHLLEKIHRHAHRQNQKVRIFADEHHTEKTSVSNFLSYKQYGTYGYRSSNLENIDPAFKFIDSKTSRVMQAVDMTTYLNNRRVTVKESDPRADREKKRMWDKVLPAVQRGNCRIWPITDYPVWPIVL